MIIFGTKTISTFIKYGEFNCPNCQQKRQYTLLNYKKYFHIFFIPLIPIDKLGDALECKTCMSKFVPGTVLNKNEYSPENPFGFNERGNIFRTRLAPLQSRIIALLIDWVVMVLLAIILYAIMDSLLIIILWFLYFICCDMLLNGATVGKMIFKIKVSNVDNDELPNVKNLIIRNVIKGICTYFPPIYLFALFNDNIQTLHDLAANTTVIQMDAPDKFV